MLSAPNINKLTASTNVKITTPNTGNINTATDIAKDNIPTPISSTLDHLEICLFTAPCTILAIPRRNNPIDKK